MNWAHIHLMLNHVPVVGVIIGLVFLIVGIAWKSSDIRRVTLYYFMALGLVTLIVYLTGEPAEELVENLPGISKAPIETHEEASTVALILVEIAALLSLFGLFFRHGTMAQKAWFSKFLLVVVLATACAMAWVGNLGGKIRHTEINGPGVTSHS